VDELPLTDLVTAAQHADADAFAEIVRRFERMARATGLAWLGDVHRAEDAAQDAFIESYYALPQLREAAAFPGWFRRILLKHCDRLARRERDELSLDDAPGFSDGLLDTLHTRDRVRAAVAELPDRQQQVTRLFYLAGYSQQEIVEVLAWPLPTVKKQLFQARRRLQALLREEMDLMTTTRNTGAGELSQRVRFFLALRAGDVRAVQTLATAQPDLLTALTEWAELDNSNYWPLGYTALHYACATGIVPMARALIEAGANVNALTKHKFATPLHVAVMQRQHEVLTLLLRSGANVGAANGNGQTALHFAAYRGDDEAVRQLLQAGAAAGLKDAGGHTPHEWAAHRGFDSTARLLPGKTATARAQHINLGASAMLPTGIKIVDLFAPLARGGVNAVFTPLSGVGKVVLLEQLIEVVATQYGGHTHFLGIEGRHYTGPDFAVELRDVGLDSACSLQFAAAGDTAALTGAVDAAASALNTQRETLLMADATFADAGLQARIESLARGNLTVVWYGEHTAGIEAQAFAATTSVIGFEIWRALNGFWPSVDPLRSHTTLPKGRHAALVARAKRLLRRYEDLRIIVERDPRGRNGLTTDADRVDALRGRQLHAYLSQPMTIAELWTNTFGERVPLDLALDGLQAVLDGAADEASEADLRTIAGTRLYIRH
jgi:RNA polymerase sigma factor (sigma-70 family)